MIADIIGEVEILEAQLRAEEAWQAVETATQHAQALEGCGGAAPSAGAPGELPAGMPPGGSRLIRNTM